MSNTIMRPWAVILTRRRLAGRSDPSHWRYRELLPIGADAKLPALSVGGTPLTFAPALARHLGIAQPLSERRRPQRHRIAEGPRQFRGRGEGARKAAADHRVREYRQRGVFVRGDGCVHGLEVRDLRSGARARAEGHAVAHLRRDGAARARQLRGRVSVVPALVREMGLVQPQLRHQPLPGGREEDGGPGNRRTAWLGAHGLGGGFGGRRVHGCGCLERLPRAEDAGADSADSADTGRAGGGRRSGDRRIPAAASRCAPSSLRRWRTASPWACRGTGRGQCWRCANRAAR